MKALLHNAFRLFFLLCLAFPLATHAQSQGPVSDLLRQDGKLWVVITVIAVVFTGLILYISRLNQRTDRMQNRTKSGQRQNF